MFLIKIFLTKKRVPGHNDYLFTKHVKKHTQTIINSLIKKQLYILECVYI